MSDTDCRQCAISVVLCSCLRLVLNFPVAFAPANAAGAPVHFVFRFFTGFVGSAFLSVAGGSVSGEEWLASAVVQRAR